MTLGESTLEDEILAEQGLAKSPGGRGLLAGVGGSPGMSLGCGVYEEGAVFLMR